MVGKHNHKFGTAVKRALAKFGNVPIADSHDFEDLTFVVTSLKAKAAVQIAGSIFLTGGLQCSVS